MAWWIDFFKELRDYGIYSEDNVIEVEYLRFCHMNIVREELHKFAIQWNLHKMRPSRNEDSSCGRPDLLYHVPELNGARDLMILVSLDDLEMAEQMCSIRIPEHGCSEEFFDLASIIMHENQLTTPTTPDDALLLFCMTIKIGHLRWFKLKLFAFPFC